ncbi:hypothetical protein RHMOL_Rhmol01G0284600 [Rhododendron molle]|uniref:Uncharacterized protein n=1 Tax=Rhododendron molle TaxID=49168 RepID=A0ACC0Q7U7_RHOML|nr:hypothetical protein RHMOL_Rhmol01G0284600 [Rhododendron molle]
MDVICQAMSGMGKTAVFVLSTLQQIEPVAGQVAALVLLSYKGIGVPVAVFYGGVNIKVRKDLLKNECPHTVVRTRGRILGLARDKDLGLKNMRHFILDECDKMLESLGKLLHVDSPSRRLTRYKSFKEGHKRIIVATDLVGRGIDIECFGRAGRFGTKGLAINLLHVHPTLMFSIRLEAVVRWILRNFLSKFVLPLTCHLDGYSFLAATKASYPSVIGSSSRGTGRFLREIFDVTV